MLILSRKLDESIIIGDGVKVTLLDISGKQVKLGIDAPREIAVHREEVYRQIEQEEKAAHKAKNRN